MSDSIIINTTTESINLSVNTNTDVYSLSVVNVDGASRWGLIIGSLSAQTDLWRFLSGSNVSTELLTLSSNVLVIDSLLNTLSGNWNNAYSNLVSNSAAYLSSVNLDFLSVSGNWNNSYNWVASNSANAIFKTVSAISLSGIFYGDGSNLIGASLPGQANINSLVRSNSAEWNNAYTNLVTNSAAYLSAADLSFLHVSGNWNNAYTSLTSLSGDWQKAYTLATGLTALSSSWLTAVSGTANQINASKSGSIVTLSFPNSAIFPGAVSVIGNLTVLGTATYINTQNLVIGDNLIYLNNDNYGSNVLDIGLVSHFTQAPLGYNHTGLVRRAGQGTPGVWTLFSGLTTEPVSAANIDWADNTIRLDTLSANLISDTIQANSIGIGSNAPYYFDLDVNGSKGIGNSYGNLGIGSSNDILINPNGNLILTQDVGDVGIGNSAPVTKLHVTKTSNSVEDPVAIIESTGGQAPFTVRAGGVDQGYVKGDTEGFLAFGAKADVVFEAGGFGQNHEVARFTSSGNIGIGTTTPTQKLDVHGNILASGTATVSSLSATDSVYTSNLIGSGSEVIFSDGLSELGHGASTLSLNFTNGVFISTTLSAGAYYGDGSHLTGVVTGGGRTTSPFVSGSSIGSIQPLSGSNTASGEYSSILGGSNNNTNSKTNTFILGSGITATKINTTYVNNLSASSTVTAATIKTSDVISNGDEVVISDGGSDESHGSSTLSLNFLSGVYISNSLTVGASGQANVQINQLPATFVNPVTASGTFLIVNINGVQKAIRLWDFTT